ncbi:MAG TPA: hypothetical protein PLV92_14460, partial [Pirellulaceae bacterium]|nr:hypothetical protein [Pirellulaceae bacterium]
GTAGPSSNAAGGANGAATDPNPLVYRPNPSLSPETSTAANSPMPGYPTGGYPGTGYPMPGGYAGSPPGTPPGAPANSPATGTPGMAPSSPPGVYSSGPGAGGPYSSGPSATVAATPNWPGAQGSAPPVAYAPAVANSSGSPQPGQFVNSTPTQGSDGSMPFAGGAQGASYRESLATPEAFNQDGPGLAGVASQDEGSRRSGFRFNSRATGKLIGLLVMSVLSLGAWIGRKLMTE